MDIKDIDEVTEIYKTCFSDKYISFSELSEGKISLEPAVETFKKLLEIELKTLTNYYNLICVDENSVIMGFICNSYSLNYANNIECWLEDWCVLPEYQGKGVGKALFEGFKTWAKSLDAKYAFTESGINNHEAHLAVQKLGFKPVATVFAIEF